MSEIGDMREPGKDLKIFGIYGVIEGRAEEGGDGYGQGLSLCAVSELDQMILDIRYADPSDTLHIHIDSPGGDIDTAGRIVGAIKASQAKTVAIVEGRCYSAAVDIFLACDDQVVDPCASIMVHPDMIVTSGTYQQVSEEVAYGQKSRGNWFQRTMVDSGFLTTAQEAHVRQGGAVWMDQLETKAGLRRRRLIRKEWEKFLTEGDNLPGFESCWLQEPDEDETRIDQGLNKD